MPSTSGSLGVRLSLDPSEYKVILRQAGIEGKSIVSAEVNSRLNLLLTMSDGSVINAGYIGTSTLDGVTEGTLDAGIIQGGTF